NTNSGYLSVIPYRTQGKLKPFISSLLCIILFVNNTFTGYSHIQGVSKNRNTVRMDIVINQVALLQSLALLIQYNTINGMLIEKENSGILIHQDETRFNSFHS